MVTVLIVYDVDYERDGQKEVWAYGRRAEALARHAPPDIQVTVAAMKEIGAKISWHSVPNYDVVFLLDYSSVTRFHNRTRKRGNLIVSFNKDSNSKREEFKQTVKLADLVVCNCKQRFESAGRIWKTCAISNGIELDYWRPVVPVEERPEVVFWTGSSGPAKRKGYQDILVPATDELESRGFRCVFVPIDEVPGRAIRTKSELLSTYNQSRYIVCMSATEGGGPNVLYEGIGCGCVPVTTNVGGACELVQDGVTGVVVPRTVQGLVDGLERARDGFLGYYNAMRKELDQGGWDWSVRSLYFWAAIRKFAATREVKPFSYDEVTWESI